MRFTLQPIFGWPATIAVIVVVLAVTAALAIRAHRQAPDVDSTAVDWGRRCAVSAVICLMMLGPSTMVQSTTRAVSATDVVIALDVTGSMAVDDASYPGTGGEKMTRITAASYVVSDLTKLYPDSSFAALSFGGDSSTLGLPLTPDVSAVTSWVDDLYTEPTGVSSGSNPSAPLDGLTTVLSDMRSQHQNDRIVLYYISDGEQTADGQRNSFSALRAYVDDAVVVGVGSDDGGTVPQLRSGLRAGDAYPDGTTWVTDPDTGQPGVSKRDSATLSAIADELSGVYQAVDASSAVQYPASGQSQQDYQLVRVEKQVNSTNPIVWPFAAVLAALLLWEAIAHARTSRRLL